MPTPTYTALATVTLGASAASVTFSSIPATYRDLVLVANYFGTSNSYTSIRVNGLTTGIYNRVVMYTPTLSASVANATSMDSGEVSTSARTFDIYHFMDYSATDKHKSMLFRTNDSNTAVLSAQAGRIATTDAITSILIFPNSGSYAATSTFSLYGVIA
jgi:hypothetical protein